MKKKIFSFFILFAFTILMITSESLNEDNSVDDVDYSSSKNSESILENETSKNSFGFNAKLGLGTQYLGGETWQSISFMPDLSFGKIGFGLDLQFNYTMYRFPTDTMGIYPRLADWAIDKDGDGKVDPWTKDSLQEYLDLYLSKITYFRYGEKGNPLYFKIGLLENTRLGNGFILNGYSNGLLRPEYKYTGLQLDVDGTLFNFPYLGLETFVNSISTYDVLGLRLFARPLHDINSKLFKKLQIGSSFVFDSDPYVFYRRLDNTHLIENEEERDFALEARSKELNRFENSNVFIWGIDFFLPVVNLDKVLSLNLLGDFVLQASAPGANFGFEGNLFFINYGASIRFLAKNFLPVYFDRSYDLRRVEKLKTYLLNTDSFKNAADLAETPESFGWFFFLGTSLFDQNVLFYASLEGPFGKMSEEALLTAEAWPRLKGLFSLDISEISPMPISLTGFYEKEFLKSFEDLISPEDALVGANLSYNLGAVSLQLSYNLKFIPEDRRIDGGSSWETSSKLEAIINLK